MPAQQQDCYPIERQTRLPPKIYFEFDLAHGTTTEPDPPPGADYSFDGEHISTYRKGRNGFRFKQDGNRIEIATKRFPLNDSGRHDMKETLRHIFDIMNEINRECRGTAPNTSLGYTREWGAPRAFNPSGLRLISSVKWVFPIQLRGEDPYYRAGGTTGACSIAASPQATFELPLAKIGKLIQKIKESERRRKPGLAFSAPLWSRWRQGKKSQALYDAWENVRRSRQQYIRRRTRLPNGDIVTARNFSDTLEGLLILMVSYLRTSMLKYNYTDRSRERDHEGFAKAYLPLNVKNPFRLLFDDLTLEEKAVFKRLYDSPRENLWALAKRSDDTQETRGDNPLFPEGPNGDVHEHLSRWFKDPLTWNDFVERTIRGDRLKLTRTVQPAYYLENTPHEEFLLVTEWRTQGQDCVLTLTNGDVRRLPQQDVTPCDVRKHEELGCEVLFAPLNRILPYEKGSRRVAVEMRRLGFNWVFMKEQLSGSGGWIRMTKKLFDLARELNR